MKLRGTAVFLSSLIVLCSASCAKKSLPAKTDALARAYDVQSDWNDPNHIIPLGYQQAQGRRIFFADCVWCHSDSTPAGPSNRSNLSPNPALINDGAVMNPLSDDFLRNIITLGGSALGKSAMMPPWGKTLTPDEVSALIAYTRAVAQPPYQAPVRPQPKYSVR